MPAVSRNQRLATAIALHHPSELYKRNQGLTAMSDEQLEDFARTKEKGLPKSKNKGLAKGLKKASSY